MGRKLKPLDQKRNKILMFRVSEQEKTKIESRVKKSKSRQLAKYLRDAILNHLPPTIPEANRELWKLTATLPGQLQILIDQIDKIPSEQRSNLNLNEIINSINIYKKEIQELRVLLIGGKPTNES